MTYILDVNHFGVIWKVVMVELRVIHCTEKYKAEWAKITHSYIPGEFYENTEKFMQAVCNNI